MRKSISKGLCEAAELVLLTGACAGTGAFIGAAGHFYKEALKPKKRDARRDADPSEKEYAAGRRWMKNHPLREDAYIRGDDGLQLHGNFIPSSDAGASGTGVSGTCASGTGTSGTGVSGAATSAAGTSGTGREHCYAICVHGYGDASDSMGLYASVYHDRYGMNVLLPDLRGHGRSDGDYVAMGYDDSRDLLHWIDWVLEKDHTAKIILHGISMGAATVLMTTGYRLPKQVAAAISDSSYSSAREEFLSVYRSMDEAKIPAPLMIEAVRAIALVRTGYDIDKAAPVRAVAHSKTPTLFIHGQADTFVPPEMMPALYKAASCPKAFQWFPEAEHVQSVNVDPETYWARIERFLHAQEIAVL